MKLKSQTPIPDIVTLIGSQDGMQVTASPLDEYAPPPPVVPAAPGTPATSTLPEAPTTPGVPQQSLPPVNLAAVYPGLSQVARGTFAFFETNNRFPAAKINGGLSWRVAILPFIGQKSLYEKFHLDEPWDSPHNKSLVAQMPNMYKIPGVDSAGKTSLHVVDDPAAPFGVSGGVAFNSLTDGSSNILMIVIAGPEVATEWTRPGGLPFDPNNPVSAWGSPQAGVYPTAAFDGSLKALRADAPAAQVALYVQHADNKPVDKTIFLSP